MSRKSFASGTIIWNHALTNKLLCEHWKRLRMKPKLQNCKYHFETDRFETLHFLYPSILSEFVSCLSCSLLSLHSFTFLCRLLYSVEYNS
uniref:Uncharacterized protein n=1 Tax=Cryptomonas curvata TaxID=233186 RepID=A0A7S0MBB2_9CRYP